MIFSSLNNNFSAEKDFKIKRDMNSYEDEYDLKKYNTLLEIKKEMNEERKNDNTFLRNKNNIIMNNQNDLFKFNTYKNIRDNELFHKNLNYELEKNKIKLLKGTNNNENNNNNNNQRDINNILNQINQNSPQDNISEEHNEEIKILKEKISQYETSLENTKLQYQKQINFYIQQLTNYNILITIITNFFNNISKKYIPNYNFNIPNQILEENNFISLNQKDIEDKFNKIEQYISELNDELNEYKKKDNFQMDKIIDIDKNEIDKLITNNYNIKDSLTYTNLNNNIFSPERDFIFKNEIVAKKIRSKSGTKPRIQYNKKINSNKTLFKNKNSKNEHKLTKRNNSYRGSERNNNLDIIQYTKKKKKKSKASKDIPIKLNKKNKSKTDIKKLKSINLK